MKLTANNKSTKTFYNTSARTLYCRQQASCPHQTYTRQPDGAADFNWFFTLPEIGHDIVMLGHSFTRLFKLETSRLIKQAAHARSARCPSSSAAARAVLIVNARGATGAAHSLAPSAYVLRVVVCAGGGGRAGLRADPAARS